MRTVPRAFPLITAVLIAFPLVLASCSQDSGTAGTTTQSTRNSRALTSSDGDLPFSERRNIESFQRDIEPSLRKFVQRLSESGAGEYTALSEPRINGCSDNRYGAEGSGYILRGQIVRGVPLSADTVRSLAREILVPVGYNTPVEDTGKNRLSLVWYDTAHGGYVSVVIRDGEFITVGYSSACRPSDGFTKPDQFVPERPADRPYIEHSPSATPEP